MSALRRGSAVLILVALAAGLAPPTRAAGSAQASTVQASTVQASTVEFSSVRPQGGVNALELIGEPEGTPLQGEELLVTLDEVTELMRCPVCQGLSVADSPVASALAIREEVRSLLAAGYTRDQIFDYFEGAYGEFIRLSPRARGFNLVVWIAPIVMVLIGIGLVWSRTRRREGTGPSVETDESLRPYRDRVRQEVGY